MREAVAVSATTLSVNCRESVRVMLSASLDVAVTVNVEAPVVVGVPEIVPSAPNVSPAGNWPMLTFHVTTVVGWSPATSFAEYGEPATAVGREVVLIPHERGQTSNVNRVCALFPSQSCSESHAVHVPDSVGTPETRPLLMSRSLSVKPGGSWPESILK